MDTQDLEALVPTLMSRCPHFRWRLAEPRPGVLRVELHPRTHPDRLAAVEVNPGAEVYLLCFMGWDAATDYAYDDPDRREVFASVLDDAIALATGPSRVTRRMVDDVQISCEMVIAPDSQHERRLGQHLSHPLSYVKARLRGRRTTEVVTDLPSISPS